MMRNYPFESEEDVISVYTRDDAINDGIIFNAGRIANRDVDLQQT